MSVHGFLCVSVRNLPVWPLRPLCASPGWSLHAHINLTVERGGHDLWGCSFKAGQFQSEQSAVVSGATFAQALVEQFPEWL